MGAVRRTRPHGVDAIRSLRASHPNWKTFYFDMIDEAMKAIEERIEQARQRHLVRLAARPQPELPGTGGLGRPIPDPEGDELHPPLSPARQKASRRKPAVSSRAAFAPRAENPADDG